MFDEQLASAFGKIDGEEVGAASNLGAAIVRHVRIVFDWWVHPPNAQRKTNAVGFTHPTDMPGTASEMRISAAYRPATRQGAAFRRVCHAT
jgi:hypothetical protein